MNPAIVKYRLWKLARRMDAQPATYTTRTAIAANSGATDDGADGGTPYGLLRVTYTDDLTSAEMSVRDASIADVWRLWIIYQADLDQASAPRPVPLQTLAFPDGTSWIIERVSGTAMNQAWRCLSRKMH